MKNESGVYPVGRRVLIRPDVIEEKVGQIVLPTQELDKHEQAISTGILIAVGADAFTHGIETVQKVHTCGRIEDVEIRTDGRKEPYAVPGDRVAFAIFGGKDIPGKDGLKYRLMNDEDITARVDDEVEFGTFESARAPINRS